MFIKCAQCGYLTPDASATCKQCGSDPLTGPTTPAAVGPPATPPAPDPAPAPIGEPFAASAPSPPPAWPPAPVPTRPMNIFDVPPPPGAPPAGPSIPAMFPQPGAQPPKRNVAVTVLGVVAIAVVLALVIGAAFGRSSSPTSTRPVATSPPSPVATVDTWTMRQALPAGNALGPDWTVMAHDDLEPYALVWDETCWDAPGLQSVAQGGTSVDQGLAVDAAGNDRGEAEAWIKQYGTGAEVDAQLTARLDPQYGACAAEFARNDLACSCQGKTATDSTLTTVAAPAGVRAAVYRTELHYVDEQGNTRPFSVVHAYVGAGRWLGSLRVYEFDTPVDQQWFDAQLTAFAQQLALRAPS